ncbi:hypothetical protein N7481_003180 [Penicillium waksmanii]|uniref:uncharacterized protein n=1 Tax=Penicillium waksmanii TaxID=69791 RepID=UPI00254983E3|nr:uncharacterized protein N7481_003180 [Penicillium waksmanii]KAJ5987970.1 hypothetical protein N7481_003180 [Penicillium waksmanii]
MTDVLGRGTCSQWHIKQMDEFWTQLNYSGTLPGRKQKDSVTMIPTKSLVEDHPDRLVSEYALAMAYKDKSQTEESIKLLTRTATIEA